MRGLVIFGVMLPAAFVAGMYLLYELNTAGTVALPWELVFITSIFHDYWFIVLPLNCVLALSTHLSFTGLNKRF